MRLEVLTELKSRIRELEKVAEPMDIDIDPEVDRKYKKSMRNRQLAKLGGLALGTGLGVVAGEKVGRKIGGDFGAGYGSGLGGIAGGTLGMRTGTKVAELLQAPDYDDYGAEFRKNLPNA